MKKGGATQRFVNEFLHIIHGHVVQIVSLKSVISWWKNFF